jgi:secreted PhoX family phosphatase
MSGSRRLLPLVPSPRHGSRSHMTCHYRCGNACDQPDPNRSGNETMQQIVERTIARRAVLQAGAVAGGAVVLDTVTAGQALAHDVPDRITGDFRPVRPNNDDLVVVPTGYLNEVVIRWGDPVLPGAPTFDVMSQTPEHAALRFGYNNDYIGVLQTGRRHAFMVCNHEFTNPELMFPEGVYDPATMIRIEMASHGMSVVELRRRSSGTGRWTAVPVRKAERNRRITASTPFRLDGPAAGGSPRGGPC